MTGDAARFRQHATRELGKAIAGQADLIQQLLVVLLTGGHALLEGVPGTAKTLAAKSLARLCRLEFQRVQCTPDLMPADILGVNTFDMAAGKFVFHRGPIFTDLLLVDEVNRMPPRTQAALLEPMEERQVTLDGTRCQLSDYFTVFATQNPVEFEGTYPLPEAQIDRFWFKIRVGYPAPEAENEMLSRYQRGFDPHHLENAGIEPVETELLAEARQEVRGVRVETGLFNYVSSVTRRTRDWPSVGLGASPRATVYLMLAAKTLAALDGRDYLIPDDVQAAAPLVLRHRILVRPEAELEGITPERIIEDVLASVEVPK
ncbi:MAG: AAA family ATPase [Terriglobia bacterium]